MRPGFYFVNSIQSPVFTSGFLSDKIKLLFQKLGTNFLKVNFLKRF